MAVTTMEQNIEVKPEIDTFDYSVLDRRLVERLREKDYVLMGLHSKYSQEVGKVLYEAQQDFSDYNNGGLFEKWYTSRGFKKQNVYNYISIYNEVQNLDGDRLEVFNGLPKSLQIEASKKSVDPEIKEKILNGDITSTKEFKEERTKRMQAEKQAEQERKERERLEEENERLADKADKEPEVRYVESEPQEPYDRRYDRPFGVERANDLYNMMNKVDELYKEYAHLQNATEELYHIAFYDEDLEQRYSKANDFWRMLSDIFYGKGSKTIKAEFTEVIDVEEVKNR